MIVGPGIIIGPGIALSETAGPPPPPPPSPPVANFSGTPLSGTQPLTVNFTDSSTGSPTSYAWDFTNSGNTDSTSQNPSYVYNTAGTYSVKLTATNSGGSNSLTRTNYVTVNPNENLPQPQWPNDDFASGTTGWTAFNNQVFWSGVTTLAGYPTPTLPDPLPYSPNQVNFSGWSITPTFSSSLVSDIPVESTGQSVSLVLGDGFLNEASRGGTPYGPAIFSNYFVAFNAGDYCAFNWRAVSNTDAFSIYAYMVNVDTGATISLLRSTAPNLTFSTSWRTATILVPTTGNYKFVFVTGSWDSTRGLAIGATFYINNIQRFPASPQGQELFTTAGTYSWTAPAGVTSVSVACVGGGGGGSGGGRGSGGGGGGLGWKNNITVVPGQSYTVVVGAGGTGGNGANGVAGGNSYFIDNTTVMGGGGQGGVFAANVSGGTGGTFVGTKGGRGGRGGKSSATFNLAGGGGGGGAGGYNNTNTAYGTGGDQGGSNGFNGASGGGGGGWASGTSNGFGGGVGLKGQGFDGVRGSGSAATAGSDGTGQLYGGGGGGNGLTAGSGFNGAVGAVRIMWGINRLYPTFNTADV